MNHTHTKKNRSVFLCILLLLHALSPTAVLFARSPHKQHFFKKTNLHLPSRKAFKEIASAWEGLQPAAYIKNKSKKIGNTDTPEQTIAFIAAQQGSLKKHSEVKPIAEALEYLSDLASPGGSFDLLNSTPRAMIDLQVFGEKGFYKNINRTSLAMGQALQITQLYQGASSECEATERRDLITAFLKNPDLTKAICIRIKSFQQFEAQFLRQTKASLNQNLENKIEKLAPAWWFGKLREDKDFIRLHAFYSQKMADISLFGYEHLKAMYLFSTLLTVFLLVTSKRSSTFLKNTFSKLIANTAATTGSAPTVASTGLLAPAATPTGTQHAPTSTTTATQQASTGGIFQQIPLLLYQMVQQYFERNPSATLTLGQTFYDQTLESPTKRTATKTRLSEMFTSTAGLRMLLDLAAGPLTAPISFLGEKTSPYLKALKDPIVQAWKTKTLLQQLRTFSIKIAFKEFKANSEKNKTTATFPSWRMNALESGPQEALSQLKRVVDSNKSLAQLLVIDKEHEGNFEQTPLKQFWNWLDPMGIQRYNDSIADVTQTINGATKMIPGGTDQGEQNFQIRRLGAMLGTMPGLSNLVNSDIGLPSFSFLNPFAIINRMIESPASKVFKLIFGSGHQSYWNTGFLGTRMRSLIYSIANPFTQDLFKQKTFIDHTQDGHTYRITFAPNLFNLASFLRPIFYPFRKARYGLMSQRPVGLNPGIDSFLTMQMGDAASAEDSFLNGFDENAFKLFKVEQLQADGSVDSTSPVSKGAAGAVLADILQTDKISGLLSLKSTEGLTGEDLAKAEAHNSPLISGKLKWKKCILALEAALFLIIVIGALGWSKLVFQPGTKVMMYDVLDKYMFESLKPSVTLAELTRQISGICKSNAHELPLPGSLREKLAHLAHTTSPECQEFSLLAQNKLFLSKEHPGRFGDIGTLRRAYQLLKKPVVKEWIDICATIIAEFDSYTGMARLVIEHKDIKNPYAPIEFVQQDTPFVHVENFWFPLLNPYLQKASTLTFGSLEDKDQAEQLELQALLPPNVLLTGINGAGKTIVLKGIVWAIMMAKTFGYAPLTRGVMTFIDRMIVHLSSTDNAAEGESCWIAEAKAMGEAIHAMQAPRQGLEKILFIGDELGSGTADHASIAAVAQLIQIAVETPHVSTIITTHLRILTELERISNGRILNYCVGKRLLPDGSIEGRFQLQRGRAENNIAEKIVNDLLHKGKVDITDHSQPQEESFPVDDSEKSEQTEEVPV